MEGACGNTWIIAPNLYGSVLSMCLSNCVSDAGPNSVQQ